ncbi:MAG TPA: NADH-quinone oxidoreductase subunit J [Dehalococcoidia bacterium]|nr:NADH-quinone oxidoreductase subunit J [Dehalococcoidia bacterium]
MSGFGPIFFFYVLAVCSVGSALAVVAARTIIHSVFFLVLFFVFLAAMFVLLSADFLAVAQLLIYAGAIGVLVVFAVLLTPPRERRRLETVFVGPGLIAGAAVAALVIFVAFQTDWSTASGGGFSTTVDAIGRALLSQWGLAFEIASVLLLAAMVGAIVLVRGRRIDDVQLTPGPAAMLERRER